MKTSTLALIAITVLVPGGWLLAQASRPEPPRSAGELFIRADKARPVAKPKGQERVAVLQLRVTMDKGRATNVEVIDRKLIATVPPKVLARSGGDWEVTLGGKDGLSYRIPNPALDIEVENPPGSKSPFSQVRQSGVVETSIVVPLSRGANKLAVEEIMIRDVATGKSLMTHSLRKAKGS